MSGSRSSTCAWAASTRDRRAAGLPRLHGQAERARPPLRGGGDRDSAGDPRRPDWRLHDGHRCSLDVHEHVGVRQLRRARATPRPPPGRRPLAWVPRAHSAAHSHAAEPHPSSDRLLAHPLSGALEGRVAIVTGGAQGIGNAIARGLAAEDARVVVADLQRADEAARQLDGLGLTVDVSDESQVEQMVEDVVERYGRIDILVNNAGLYASLEMRPFTEIPADEWRRVMDVNILSMFLTCRTVVPRMRERGGGRIVNISSGTPFRGVPFLLHYVTSKGAIVALTRALAKELGGDEVLVNCVAPGFTMSEGVREHPEVIEALRDVSVAARTLQRDQQPEDVVGAVVFLCGPGAAFITGQTIVIDGGQYFH